MYVSFTGWIYDNYKWTHLTTMSCQQFYLCLHEFETYLVSQLCQILIIRMFTIMLTRILYLHHKNRETKSLKGHQSYYLLGFGVWNHGYSSARGDSDFWHNHNYCVSRRIAGVVFGGFVFGCRQFCDWSNSGPIQTWLKNCLKILDFFSSIFKTIYLILPK